VTITTGRTENDALIEAVRQEEGADRLEPGNIYAFKLNDSVQVVDLLDRDRETPLRKTGTVVVKDVPSFCQYYGKHADDMSEVFVDVESGIVTAVLDAHGGVEDEPRWGDHRVRLVLAVTDAWKRWTIADRKLVRQHEFADFIDDNRADIVKPAAADMLEFVQHFQSSTKVTFNSAAILQNGNRRLVFTEETDAGGGSKGQIEVPTVLQLALAPFDDSPPYEVNARFRYRVQGGGLHMGFLLDNADDVRKDAVKTVVEKIETELGITVMRGTPSS